jgi:hypothetical protein
MQMRLQFSSGWGSRFDGHAPPSHRMSAASIPANPRGNRNVEHALYAIKLLFEPGDVIEIRALDVGCDNERRGYTRAGYFNFENVQALVCAIRSVDGRAEGIYVVLNRLNPTLLARANNRLKAGLKNTTTDADIIERRWLFVDVDPVRRAGVSSTNAEHKAALDCAAAIRMFLDARGWPEPIYGGSGNGAREWYREAPKDTNPTLIAMAPLKPTTVTSIVLQPSGNKAEEANQ